VLFSYAEGNEAQVHSLTIQLADDEARKGNGRLAEALRALFDRAKTDPRLRIGSDPLAINRPKEELASLFRVVYPKTRLGDLIVSTRIEQSLSRVVKEQRHLSKLLEHGLSPRRKILLVGSPGTGKMTASALAGELGIPLFAVRLDALLTKFMGGTAAKLRQIFDALHSVRGIYFFDEFDAIGGQRVSINDVGEARRILNSFLVMIEKDTSNSLIIAATHHPEILDDTLFRRFDDVIEYELPTPGQIAQILNSRLGRFAPALLDTNALARAAEGLSHAEITRAAEEVVKDAVMHDAVHIDPEELAQLLQQRTCSERRMSRVSARPNSDQR
jgi:SpoVK/Ycf46/Vps4 family AAA+-type ATPase